MSFNFCNMDDAALDALGMAVHIERKRRFLANVSTYPRPRITDGRVEDIRNYYHTYKDSHNIGLLQAKLVVDYWNNRLNQDQGG